MPDFIYPFVYFNLLLILTSITAFSRYSRTGTTFLSIRVGNDYRPWFLGTLLVVFIGFRPVEPVFVDMENYARVYEDAKYLQSAVMLFDNTDFLFNALMYFCAKVVSFTWFAFFVSLLYFLLPLLSIRYFFQNNDVWIAFLMYMGSFVFFGYATNGIQNGMAAAVFIYALSQIDRKWLFYLLLFLSVGLHNAMLLPVVAVFASLLHKNSKTYLILWFAAIPLSIIGGVFFEDFFSSLGFDDRMNRYLNPEENTDATSGFRLDFLLYSSMPVLVGCYVIFKHRITSKYYTLLLNTYTISNTFWILIIQVSFGYRFAYLSWFLYPIVLIYPFLNFPLSGNQQKKAALIVFLHFFFTYLMWIRG